MPGCLASQTKRKALESWLDFYRVELLARLEGLDEEQAGRRVLGSLTTLHGLVRHLTKVEHIWFVRVLAERDEPAPFGWPEIRDGDFRLDNSGGLDADVTDYLAACAHSREIVADLDMDAVPGPAPCEEHGRDQSTGTDVISPDVSRGRARSARSRRQSGAGCPTADGGAAGSKTAEWRRGWLRAAFRG